MLVLMRPRTIVKLFLLSFLFLMVNGFFYWGLLSQSNFSPQGITPQLNFSKASPLLVSGVTGEEIFPQKGRFLVVGDELRTSLGQEAEIRMGQNTLRLNEGSALKLLGVEFHPKMAYVDPPAVLRVELKEGGVWVSASDMIQVESKHHRTQFAHALGSVDYREGVNHLKGIAGLAKVELTDQDGSFLNQFTLPLLTQATFYDDQLSADFASLQPSKLRKEVKLSSLPAKLLDNPWIRFYQVRQEEATTKPLKPIYSRTVYRFVALKNTLHRVFTRNETKKNKVWLQKGIYTARYWLGRQTEENADKEWERIRKSWVKVEHELLDESLFENWLTDLFFQQTWGELNSSEFALKEALFEALVSRQGPLFLRDLINQTHLAFLNHEVGRAQRFTEKWLNAWKQEDLARYQEEFKGQFEMMQQLGLSYPQAISSVWLNFLDQAADPLLNEGGGGGEFELALTQARLAQVAALIQVYRYDFAKDYLRTSYEKLQLASRLDLSASEEVFFELGKLLAQRIEYAHLTFGGAARPIDEEAFYDFVLKSKQSDLLSNDLVSFLTQEESEVQPAPFLPTLSMVIESLQIEGLILNETNVRLSQEDPFAFVLSQVRFHNLEEVERTFDALYFPLNQTLSELVVEGQSVQGIFQLSALARALSIPELIQASPEKGSPEVKDFSNLLHSSQQDTGAERVAQELARQLAYNQLIQENFLLSPSSIQILDSENLERVVIQGAAWQESSSALKLDFEMNTALKRLYQIKNAETQRVYLEEVSLAEVSLLLPLALQKQAQEEEGLSLFQEALKDQPVEWKEEFLRFLSESVIQVTEIQVKELPLSLNAIFDAQQNLFLSLSHPLYTASQISMKEYIPALIQAYVDDFLKQEGLPMSGNWQIREPFNRLKVSNYRLGKHSLAFTLNLQKGVFENVQYGGSTPASEELTVDQLKLLEKTDPETP